MEMKVCSIGFRVEGDVAGDTSWTSSEFTPVKSKFDKIIGFTLTSASPLFSKNSKFFKPFSVEETPFVPLERVEWISFNQAFGWLKIS